MPRIAVVAALMLMLLTGIVLGQIHRLVSPGSATVPASNPLALQTAERFYGAVNTMMESGDPAALRAALKAGFLDHSQNQDSGSSDDLEAWLLELRQAFPGLRLDASNTVVHGDLVATSLTVTGSAQGVMNGIPIESAFPQTGFELLRIEGNKVAERWASPTLPFPAQIDMIGTLDSVASTSLHRTLRLERLTLARYARHDVSSHAGSVIIVESGSIGLQISADDAATPSEDQTVQSTGALLPAGEPSSIPAGAAYQLSNTGLQPASVLLLTLNDVQNGAPSRPATAQHDLAPGVTREPLVIGSSIRPDHGPYTITMNFVELRPGMSIAHHRIEETELLLVREGSIEVETRDGEVGLTTEQDPVSRQSGSLILAAGQGITVYPGTEVAYRATGQSLATILLVKVDPANHE